jgi:hypothetical protein
MAIMLAHTTGNTGVGLALALSVLAVGASIPGARYVMGGNNVRMIVGETVALGNGTARTYLTMNGNQPVELGIAISKAAMKSLPAAKLGAHGDHEAGETFFPNLLPLPKDNPTPFRLVELDWNPMGHEPSGVYDKPHFDFHFYTIDRAEWETITPEDPSFQQKGTLMPAAAYVPAGYIAPAPLVVPKMGLHWVNPRSAEIAGKAPFSTTFIYGSWNGKFIFSEPMITKAFIETVSDTTMAVPVAEKYETAGYYPSSYRIRFDEQTQEYRVALTGFAKR